MRTIVLGANPDIEAVMARRRQLGQDLFDVEEIIVADPGERSVRCFRRAEVTFADAGTSLLFGIDADSLAAEIDWP